MKAIAVLPGTPGSRLVDRAEPQITAPDEVKLQVMRVGICGTDREEVSGGRAAAPPGQKELVIGHEMLGRVMEIGSAVRRVKTGEYAIFSVRRSCGKCIPCQINRSDMCRTGNYSERGIKGLDGYQTEFVVDKEQYLASVPDELEAVGVLLEPLSIVEKAIDEIFQLQAARCPDAAIAPDWMFGRRCLVAGLGPVGLLAAMVLRLQGCEVYGMDVVEESSARPQWLKGIDGHYIDARKTPADQLAKTLGLMDVIFEATGIAKLEFSLLDALGLNGAYVITGIPGGDRPLQIPGAALIRQLVLNNQLMLGSVNAARGHFQMGVDHLGAARLRWGAHLEKLITQHYSPDKFEDVLKTHGPDVIKEVIEWSAAEPRRKAAS
ncbi:MAG: glucose 1-dehydrogenase [Terriglobia bacterium]